jgi:hypothetical protein
MSEKRLISKYDLVMEKRTNFVNYLKELDRSLFDGRNEERIKQSDEQSNGIPAMVMFVNTVLRYHFENGLQDQLASQLMGQVFTNVEDFQKIKREHLERIGAYLKLFYDKLKDDLPPTPSQI